MDDTPSSPDPLGDEPPSSALPVTRRTDHTLPHHDFSMPRSSPRKSSPIRTSPRKRTFELDVGNELSPQKILVTVEAEEALRRGIGRKLFQSSSPIRQNRQAEAITTTTVPLNDEIENEATPRRRGRPRRTSNGTPMPKGKKRAGTPLQKSAKSTRRKGDPESEASAYNDTPIEPMAAPAASKPKTRARKTPQKTATTQAVPSSQVSTIGGSKRKRGRPRKAMMPDEVAILADTIDQSAGNIANPSTLRSVQEDVENLPPLASDTILDFLEEEAGRQDTPRGNRGNRENFLDEMGSDRDRTPRPGNISSPHEADRTSYQDRLDDNQDLGMSEDYPPLPEPQSDVESDFGDDHNIPGSGQDTHASDFSMIAVESLPSFQANRSAFPSDPPEMGDETNMIINQTLESLRRSTQTEGEYQSPGQLNRDNSHADEGRSGTHYSLLANPSLMRRSKSPRRQKPLPLSRQVFAGKASQGDNSFSSSIQGSTLRSATPKRFSMMPRQAETQHEDVEAAEGYEDSFSEIPEAILDAATPRPPARTTTHLEGETSQGQASTESRNAGPGFESNRLPTPDDTSSSIAGSKRAQEDDIGTSSRPQSAAAAAAPPPNSGFQSSPPIINRPRAMDFGPSQLDQEIRNTPGLRDSSPRLPPSSKGPVEPTRSLEPPQTSRPSLSPIVRVGRTLQNVMSDRPSPEPREGSLGSPFRGAANDSSRQFTSDQSGPVSMPDSPTPATDHGIPTQFNPRSALRIPPTLIQSARSNLSRGQPTAQSNAIGAVSNPFGPNINDRLEPEAPRRPSYDAGETSHASRSAFNPSVASSARGMPSSDNEVMSWPADSDNRQEELDQIPNTQPMRSQNSGFFGTRRSSVSQAPDANFEIGGERDMTEEQQHEMEADDNNELPSFEEDDDLWDIEASRPTPKARDATRSSRQPEDPRTRRIKVPSPWKRTSRRLIYREDIASPSQIEIGESPQSDAEGAPSRRKPRASDASMILRRESGFMSMADRSSPQPEDEELEILLDSQDPRSEAYMQDPRSDAEAEADPGPGPESEDLGSQLDLGSQVDLPGKPTATAETSEYSMLARQPQEAPSTQKKPGSAKSRLFGGFDIMSFFSSPATLPTKVTETKQANTSRNLDKASQSTLQQPQLKRLEEAPPPPPQPKEPQRSIWSTGLFSSMAQNNPPPSSERRSSVLSPVGDLPPHDPEPESDEGSSLSPAPSYSPEPEEPDSPEPEYSEPEEPESPEPEPEPEHSDSPEYPPSNSPEPASPEPAEPSPQPTEPSPQPSTPERQVYPPIEQKQNFTPLPGQSGDSLFRRGPSVASSQHDDADAQPRSDELQESSIMTDGTDYERLPPREKPSRWDRTLSPAKSCFRSPLKPTTPGRVVAFTGGPLSPIQAQAQAPTIQAQAQAEHQITGSQRGGGIVFHRPPLFDPLHPAPEVRETETVVATSKLSNATARRNSIVEAATTIGARARQALNSFANIRPAVRLPPPISSHHETNTAPTITTTTSTSTNAPTRLSPKIAARRAERALSSRSTAYLSQTEWTRPHWVRLDEMLQLRRRDPLRFKQEIPLPTNSRRRPLASLLGKEVAAQGASIVLEPWHLEVVEAFRLEVGGWDERALAKRVFALIVGEERRRNGKTAGSRRTESGVAT